jgi:hypothetical protein
MWKIASGLSVAGSGSEGKFHAFGSSATRVTYEMILKSDVIGKARIQGGSGGMNFGCWLGGDQIYQTQDRPLCPQHRTYGSALRIQRNKFQTETLPEGQAGPTAAIQFALVGGLALVRPGPGLEI